MIFRTVKTHVSALVIAAASLSSFFCLVYYSKAAENELNKISADNTSASVFFSSSVSVSTSSPREKPLKRVVKGLYLTAYSGGSAKKIDQIIDLIDHTELNAVVMDIKDYSGLVLFNTDVPLAKNLRLVDNRYKDLAGTIKKLHEHNIYVIARETVFQDPILAEKKPELALKNKEGGLWRDNKGLAWVDAAKKEVWNYDLAIAKDAASYGFDEINFDYVRFPSDGNMKNLVYSSSDKKYEVMRRFYEYLSTKMKDEPVWISFDMFGFVMEKKGEDDMNIGQRLDDALPFADYVCPMMYPSHYPKGYLGLKNPAADPAKILNHGMAIGAPRFEGKKAELRPWIQDFNLGAIYDAGMIRTEIDAVEKYPNSGWLLWNASNRYSDAGLKKE